MSTPSGVRRRTPLPLGLALATSLVVVVVATAFGGGAAPLDLGDPGPFVRWSLPVVRIMHDLAAAVTVGALGMAAFLVPETKSTHRRETLARLGGASALVWFVAGIGYLLTNFASLAGIGLTDPGYFSQLAAFIWDLESTRTSVISSLVVAVIALCAPLARSKGALGWLTGAALFALLPLALSGHSSASLDHMTGVNALAFHLISATIWVGGLIALLVIRPGLDKHLAVTVRRYSVVAGWCFGLLVFSGLLLSWTNVSALAGLASRYGALLVLKAVCAVLLGLAGWWHRRRTIDLLEAGARGAAPFVRLAVGEIIVMAGAMAMGVAVSRSPTPPTAAQAPDASMVYNLTSYPDPGPPDPSSWITSWQIDWLWLPVAVIAVTVYLRWTLRLRRRGDDWPLWRAVSWVVGWLFFVYFTSAGPGVYGRVLFSWHMIEHMGVAMIVPVLLVPGAPITLALRALPARKDRTMGPRELIMATVHSKHLQVFANPVVASALFFFSLAIFYFSPLFELALMTHTGHVLMMAHFVTSGYLFTWVLMGVDPGPKRWSPLALLVVLLVTISFHAFFGVVLTQSTDLLAPGFFNQLDLPWMTTPIADQQTGGAIAWGVGEAPTLIIGTVVAHQWMRRDDREMRRADRRADRDGDAELAAYNAHLAQLARGQQK